MSSRFRKFVEWATDSRYVPLGSCCSLCGKKLGFFRTGFWSTNACKLTDGELCEKCTEKLDRLIAAMPKWLREDPLQQSSFIQYNTHNWHNLTVKNATEMIAAKDQADQETLSAFGRDKRNLFRIVEVFQIEPTALQVGVARAKRLRSKVVVFGIPIIALKSTPLVHYWPLHLIISLSLSFLISWLFDRFITSRISGLCQKIKPT